MLPGERLRHRNRKKQTTAARNSTTETELMMLQEARAEVISADQKASVILAVLGIGLGVVLSGIVEGAWRPADLQRWAQYTWWIGMTFGALAAYFAGSAVWPRFRRTDVAGGIKYWGHMAEYNTLSEAVDALNRSSTSLQQRTRHQLWRVSHVVARKYANVRRAMALAAISGVCVAVVTVLG